MTILTTQAQLRKAKHVAGLMFRCAMCGEAKPVQTEGGTGYGYGFEGKLKGKPICYECCGKLDRSRMIADGRATLYLDAKARKVTNWPGTLAFHTGHIRTGYHNTARRRYDAWFNGPDGHVWHGVQYGDNTQIIHCKRTKERVAL